MFKMSYSSCVCVCACSFLQSSRPTNKDYIKILLSPPFPFPARVCACALCVSCGGVMCASVCLSVMYVFPAVRPGVNHTKVCRKTECSRVSLSVCLCVGARSVCVYFPAACPVVYYTEASFLPQHAVIVRRAPHTGQNVVAVLCVSCLSSLSSVFPAVRPEVDCVRAASGGSRRRCAGTSRAAAML